MDENARKAAFAGKFYPGNKADIEKLIQRLLKAEENKMSTQESFSGIIGGVVPHAGYVYSGYEAVHFYQQLKNSRQHIDTVVIVNPNHTGLGKGNFNLSNASTWETPMGEVHCDKEFAQLLQIEAYEAAHIYEHSAEVQIPFLQYFIENPFKIVVVTMNIQNEESARQLATKIFKAAQVSNKKIIVLASSDFSHYESAKISKFKDEILIEQILNLDSKGIASKVKKHFISACGYGPCMVLAKYATLCSEKPRTTLLRYGNSGEVQASEKVVAYASILFYSE